MITDKTEKKTKRLKKIDYICVREHLKINYNLEWFALYCKVDEKTQNPSFSDKDKSW